MDWTALFAQLGPLFIALISGGTLLQLINVCMNRTRQKALNEAESINTDVLETTFREMLYAEQNTLRKDLNEAHERIRTMRKALDDSQDTIRILQQDLLRAQLTIQDMITQHIEEVAVVNARMKITEERLTESEKARSLLQTENKP